MTVIDWKGCGPIHHCEFENVQESEAYAQDPILFFKQSGLPYSLGKPIVELVGVPALTPDFEIAWLIKDPQLLQEYQILQSREVRIRYPNDAVEESMKPLEYLKEFRTKYRLEERRGHDMIRAPRVSSEHSRKTPIHEPDCTWVEYRDY